MARRRMAYAIGPVLAGLVLTVSGCGSDDDTGESASQESAPSSTPSASSTPTSPEPSEPTASKQPPTEPTPSPSTAESRATGSPTETPTEEPMPETGPVAEAIADLADRTGADPDDIQVVTHEQVTWRDGSLGCPEPGKMYTQALVDGYRIVLRVDGQDAHYHGGASGSPFYCERPDPNGAIG